MSTLGNVIFVRDRQNMLLHYSGESLILFWLRCNRITLFYFPLFRFFVASHMLPSFLAWPSMATLLKLFFSLQFPHARSSLTSQFLKLTGVSILDPTSCFVSTPVNNFWYQSANSCTCNWYEHLLKTMKLENHETRRWFVRISSHLEHSNCTKMTCKKALGLEYHFTWSFTHYFPHSSFQSIFCLGRQWLWGWKIMRSQQMQT